MKVSGFTFLNNAVKRSYPFRESIKSILQLCDEFIVVVGDGDDNTADVVELMHEPKIKLLRSQWNPHTHMYTFAQQANIALYSCTGDWAFYIQGDEVVHEDDLERIEAAMRTHLDDRRVEGIAFDYIHFYGSHNTQAWSPRWYRQEVRIIRNNIRTFFPSDGLFPVVLKTSRTARYLNAVVPDIRMFHYGWVTSEFLRQGGQTKTADYGRVDARTLRPYTGTHPKIMHDILRLDRTDQFVPDPSHRLTARERRHRVELALEKIFGLDFAKKHFQKIG